MSDTPRTEAEAGYILDADYEHSQSFVKQPHGDYVDADFARQLERELNFALNELRIIHEHKANVLKSLEEHSDALNEIRKITEKFK